MPSFGVSKLIEVSPKWKPRSSASFHDRSAWQRERNASYGVEFAHPHSMTSAPAPDQSVQANFVTDKDTETVSTFTIPGKTYPGANLNGGSFTILVNRDITNRESCLQVGIPGPQDLPASLFVGAGMGTWYGDHYFHIFQNGLCYELAFELVEYNAHNAPAACNVPLLSQQDDQNLIKPLIASVSFFRPAVLPIRVSGPHSTHRVTEFTASFQTNDDGTNRGQIAFSWSTEGADYVELSCSCTPAPTGSGIVILENGFPYDCENARIHSNVISNRNRSPNASATLNFGNYLQSDPIAITVTITPFSEE